jgi:hypothetical protein
MTEGQEAPMGSEALDTMKTMTTREKVERLLDRLSEGQLEAEYERLRAAVDRGNADPWGDLDAWSDAAGKGTFQELDEEEAKIGFSWKKHSSA